MYTLGLFSWKCYISEVGVGVGGGGVGEHVLPDVGLFLFTLVTYEYKALTVPRALAIIVRNKCFSAAGKHSL